MNTTILRLLFSTLLVTIAPKAQTESPSSSFIKAQRILQATISAHGLGGEPTSWPTVDAHLRVEVIHRHQSPAPKRPYERTVTPTRIVLDFPNQRLRYDQRFLYPGGIDFALTALINGSQGKRFDLLNRTVRTIPSETNVKGFIQQAQRQLGFGYIAEAAKRQASLRYAGQVSHDGLPLDAVNYATSDGETLTLLIDAKERLLRGVERLVVDSVEGDSVERIVFTGYKLERGMAFPSASRTFRAAEEMSASTIAVVVGKQFDDTVFQEPSDVKPIHDTEILQKLGDDVYLFRVLPNYTVLLVGQRDSVFVMEAPVDDMISAQVLERARSLWPDKKVRTIAVTHFHDDHTGGVRRFLAEGATLLTTPGNEEYFSRVLQRNSRIAGDKAITGRVSYVTRRHTIGQGDDQVVLVDVGPGPHAKEMLVAYIPKLELVFQGDLMIHPYADVPIRANENLRMLASRLDALGLRVRKIASVHYASATMEEVRAAVADAKNAAQLPRARD